jgi:hypothetical protein
VCREFTFGLARPRHARAKLVGQPSCRYDGKLCHWLAGVAYAGELEGRLYVGCSVNLSA